MKIVVICIGKTKEPYLKEGLEQYLVKARRYHTLEWVEVDDIKNAASLPIEELKKREAKLFTDRIKPGDYVVLLDEGGKEYTSRELAKEFQRWMNGNRTQVVFLIGGAYGFDASVVALSHQKIALSQLTFTHQMIRLLLTEQIYRVFTILNNEKYHH